LNFATDLPELFAGKEMGEDALRVLNDIIPSKPPSTRTSPPNSPTSAKQQNGQRANQALKSQLPRVPETRINHIRRDGKPRLGGMTKPGHGHPEATLRLSGG